MVEEADIIKDKILRFYNSIKDLFPIKKVFLYGSYARGNAGPDSDIDVAVVVDLQDHLKRIEITSQMLHYASKIDVCIEPKCVFWDEFQKRESGSILSDIIKYGIDVA